MDKTNEMCIFFKSVWEMNYMQNNQNVPFFL